MAEAATRVQAHETADINVRRILLVAGLFAATLVAVALAAAGVMAWLHDRTARAVTPADATPTVAPSPPPQPRPPADLLSLRREKTALLDEYRWLDRDRGIVRIPIERAMALLVERSTAGNARDAKTKPEVPR